MFSNNGLCLRIAAQYVLLFLVLVVILTGLKFYTACSYAILVPSSYYSCINSARSHPLRCVLVPTQDLKGLMTALYRKVAHKWKTIGVCLEISDLDTIETKHHGDSHLCLVEMLDAWLKRVDPPPTWSAVIEAVEFLGEEQLGRELREKYILSME